MDKKQDGFISLEEFKDVHNKVGESGSPAEDPIREAFTFDKDGNNLICADELRAVLLSLGEKGHTLEDCRRMISNVDLDGDAWLCELQRIPTLVEQQELIDSRPNIARELLVVDLLHAESPQSES